MDGFSLPKVKEVVGNRGDIVGEGIKMKLIKSYYMQI